MRYIRESVDALLCRDQISRDPHTKRLRTPRERLYSQGYLPEVTYELVSSYTYGHLQHSLRESAHTRFHEFRVIFFFIFFFFSKPPISILKRVNVVLNISRVGEVCAVPKRSFLSGSTSLRYHRGTLHDRQRTTPFSVNSACATAGSRGITACVFARTDCQLRDLLL